MSFPRSAPIAQLDRASVYETEGYRFDSCWVYWTYDESGNIRYRILYQNSGTEFWYRIHRGRDYSTEESQMARIAQPWFWAERNGWFVNRNGQRHFLGDHPPNAPRPRQVSGKWNAPEAIRLQFHELMASTPEARPTTSKIGLSLADLLVGETALGPMANRGKSSCPYAGNFF
jgi:hypothetical protein